MRLVSIGGEGEEHSTKVMRIARPDTLADLGTLGLSLAESKRFLSAHAMIYSHFRPRRHLMTAGQYRRSRDQAFRVWQQEMCARMAA
jgi:hypothetical protein